jgi:hypothetical protein
MCLTDDDNNNNNNNNIYEAFRKLNGKRINRMFLIFSVGDGTGNVLLGTVVRVGSADMICFSFVLVLTARGANSRAKSPTR